MQWVWGLIMGRVWVLRVGSCTVFGALWVALDALALVRQLWMWLWQFSA